MLFEIPKYLKPKLPPMNLTDEYDSNHGIDTNYTKMCILVRKDVEGTYPWSLPRFLWISKAWTLT